MVSIMDQKSTLPITCVLVKASTALCCQNTKRKSTKSGVQASEWGKGGSKNSEGNKNGGEVGEEGRRAVKDQREEARRKETEAETAVSKWENHISQSGHERERDSQSLVIFMNVKRAIIAGIL